MPIDSVATEPTCEKTVISGSRDDVWETFEKSLQPAWTSSGNFHSTFAYRYAWNSSYSARRIHDSRQVGSTYRCELTLYEGSPEDADIIKLTVEMTERGPDQSELRWSSSGTLFNGKMSGFQSAPYLDAMALLHRRLPTKFLFAEHVFPAELRTIRLRPQRESRTEGDRTIVEASNLLSARSRSGKATGEEILRYLEEIETANPERPKASHELVGLALSGGGIRSSTFNLGLLQGLHRMGILRHVDYLSTVSGGGYIGSAWNAYTKDGGAFPFYSDAELAAEPETPATVNLRDNANYLFGGGWLDSVRMAMVVFRGVFLNFFLMVPYLLLLAVIISVTAGSKMQDAVHAPRLMGELGAFWLTKWLIAAFILWLVASAPVTMLVRWVESTPWLRNKFRSQTFHRVRDNFEQTFAVAALLIAAVGFVEAQPLAVTALHRTLADGSYRAGFAGLGTVASVAAAGLSRIGTRWGARIALFFAAILGPALPVTLYFILADALIFDPRPWLPKSALLGPDGVAQLSYLTAAVALILYARAFVDVNRHSGHPFWRDRLSNAFLKFLHGKKLVPADSLLLSESGYGPYHLLNATVNLHNSANRGRGGDFFLFSQHFIGGPRTGFIPTPVMENIDSHVNLGTAMAISSAAAAPNMGSYTVASVRFLLTLFNVRMGYWLPHPGELTRKLGLQPWEWPRHPGKWHEAISRAQPGLWNPNNRPWESSWWTGLWKTRNSLWNSWWWKATPLYLLREMLGRLDDTHDLVNVSDGGHLENLGVYELLRRRCRYIIVGDGEADGDMHFGSLAALIRFARLDLGIEIEMELGDLRLREGRPGHRHCAVGTIRYPARDGGTPEHGTLLYFKSSLTGDEDNVIAQYRSAVSDFPHESTADQVFSEQQFEAYRSLGFHVATSSLEKATGVSGAGRAAIMSYARLQRMFSDLPALFATSPEMSLAATPRLHVHLGDVVKASTPDEVLQYYSAVYRAMDDRYSIERNDPAHDARVRAVVVEQLQLMHGVFTYLGLAQPLRHEQTPNREWLRLFSLWASHEYFRNAFSQLAAEYEPSFHVFCLDDLGVEWTLQWRADDNPAPRPPTGGSIDMIGSVQVAGQPLLPLLDVICIRLLYDDTAIWLGPHLLGSVLRPTPPTYQRALRELGKWLADPLAPYSPSALGTQRAWAGTDDPGLWLKEFVSGFTVAPRGEPAPVKDSAVASAG